MSDVASLLASIGLERWTSTFEEEELDLELLSSMGVHLRASLEELGLPSADIDSLEAALAKSDGGDDGDDDLMLEENADEGDEDTPQLEDNPGDDDDGGLVVEDNEPAEKLPANGYAPYGRRPRWLDGSILTEEEEVTELEVEKEPGSSDDDLDVTENNVLYEVRANYEVLVDGLRIRAMPSTDARILDYKAKGTILTTDAARNGWVRLRDPVQVSRTSSRRGWMLLDSEARGLGKLLKRVDKMQPLPVARRKAPKKADLTRHYQKWEAFERTVPDDPDPRAWKPAQIPTDPYFKDDMKMPDMETIARANQAIEDIKAGRPVEGLEGLDPKALEELKQKALQAEQPPAPPPPPREEPPAKPMTPKDYQDMRVANLEAAREMDDIAGAGETMADIELHNEHLLRVAKDQGRQGNVVYDNTTGKLAIMDEFACGGEADLYQWGQNNWEVHLRIYVMTDTGKRDVKLHTTTQSIRLEVDGLVFIDGKLHRPIISDETTYEFSDNMEVGGRILTVTMRKMKETRGNKHWSCVVDGEAMVDTSIFGAPIQTVSAYNPNEQRAAFEDDD